MEPLKSNDVEGKIKIRDLETVLRESQMDSQLEIIDMTSSNLVPTGENYASIMVKIEAVIRRGSSKRTDTLHLVAKTLKYVKEPFMNWSVVLEKEIFAYSELIPVYKDLERAAGVDKNDLIDCAPKYMGHRYKFKVGSDEVDDQSLLVMENLNMSGYYMGDRKKGLDIDHVTVALTTLARFHALGVVLREKRPKDFEKAKLKAATFGFISDEFASGHDSMLQAFREESCFAKYMSKIELCFASLKKNGEILNATEPWITIIHGDFWTNNLLFHKDDNEIVDGIKFVDFQTYLYSSPCMDLTYFLCCSLNQDFYDYLDELFDLYYKKFIDTLRRMGCDSTAFTRESFDEELAKYLKRGFPVFALCQKYFTYEVSEEEKRDSEIAKIVMNSKCNDVCKRKLIKLVNIYDERGWF